ncbi:hypothetical protein [Christiangramia portivictoriae]|uniref:hypothetical protein n=1 Tax=Christiangramia portivictoriae TaxID=326069 RepID=UPI00041DFEA5|nr:hypothetical protein [Christiangramia portivictoriae]
MKQFTALKTCLYSLMLLSILGCNNSANSNKENKAKDTIVAQKNLSNTEEEQEPDKPKKVQSKDTTGTLGQSKTDYSGTYTNLAFTEDQNCECYCLEIQVGSSSELCLKPGELYMEANFKKVGDEIHVFYQGASVKSKQNDIPWNDLDTGTAVAVFSKVGENEYQLDWKGFQIDGKTAVDYALLGKKTLEGTYKLK